MISKEISSIPALNFFHNNPIIFIINLVEQNNKCILILIEGLLSPKTGLPLFNICLSLLLTSKLWFYSFVMPPQ